MSDGPLEIRLPDLSRIALEPGDAVWVRVRRNLVSMHDAHRLEQAIKARLPGHEVIVTADDVELWAVRPIKKGPYL